MDGFPNNCIRGLRAGNFLSEDGYVAATAFLPNVKTAESREDGKSETSVNWEDDDKAVEFTLRDHQTAAHGVAVLPVSALEYTNSIVTARVCLDDAVSYERDPLPNNPYHGNILFHAELPSSVKKLVASTLALHCSIRRKG